MTIDQFSRTRMLIGEEGLQQIQQAHIAVFGIGGVGGHCCDALVRSGILAIDLFDNDVVSLTNLNRQMIALHSTIGRAKVDVMAERLHDISPACEINVHPMFYLPETADQVDLSRYDYVIDAVDTVAAKMELITRCTRLGIPVISALGAGNKLDPGKLQVSDIFKTETDPLARVIRLECRKRGIRKLKVVYSTEPPIRVQPVQDPSGESAQTVPKGKHVTPGSISFVPAAMGLMIASAVIRDLISADH